MAKSAILAEITTAAIHITFMMGMKKRTTKTPLGMELMSL